MYSRIKHYVSIVFFVCMGLVTDESYGGKTVELINRKYQSASRGPYRECARFPKLNRFGLKSEDQVFIEQFFLDLLNEYKSNGSIEQANEASSPNGLSVEVKLDAGIIDFFKELNRASAKENMGEKEVIRLLKSYSDFLANSFITDSNEKLTDSNQKFIDENTRWIIQKFILGKVIMKLTFHGDKWGEDFNRLKGNLDRYKAKYELEDNGRSSVVLLIQPEDFLDKKNSVRLSLILAAISSVVSKRDGSGTSDEGTQGDKVLELYFRNINIGR